MVDATRFIFQDRLIFKEEDKPKPGAFMPEMHPELRRYETSVCGCDDTSEERIWQLGRTVRPGKPAIARADFDVVSAQKENLSYEPAPEENYAEHAVLIGWPIGGEDEKARQKMVATNLASAATLRKPE